MEKKINTINFFKNNNKELLSDKVYKYLKSEIIKGIFNKDSDNLVLSENYISKKLNVSRTPVREAMKRLHEAGFISYTSNSGSIVTKISIDDLKEILQIRRVIEGLAIRLASKKINNEKIICLKNIVRQARGYIPKKDSLSFCDLDIKFHDLIIDSSGNRRLKKIYENLKDQYLQFRIKSFSNLSRLEDCCREMEGIIRALENHSNLEAESLLKEHINNGYKNILATYEKE